MKAVITFSILSVLCFRAHAKEPITLAVGSTVAAYINSLKAGFDAHGNYALENIKDDGMGSDAAVLALDKDKVDLAIIGSPWEDVQLVLKEKKADIKHLGEMTSQVVAWDKVVFVVSNGLPVDIPTEKFKQLLVGRISNWKELGGPDVPVQLALQANTPATQKLISMKLLGGEDINKKGVKIFGTYDEMVSFIGSQKGALGFGPPSMKIGNVVRLKEPELTKPFVALTRGPPSAKVRALLEYIGKNPPPK